MNHGKKLFLLPALLVLATLFLAVKTYAQQTSSNYDVTVSPIFFDLSANPGDTITTKVRIRNNTSSPLPIKLGVEKLTGDLNGNLTLQQSQSDYTLSWFKFNSDTVTASPLEWTDVPFTINVPKDAAYGYYWTITFTQGNNPTGKSGVALTGAAGVPVLLKVNKAGALSRGKIRSFTTDVSFYEYPPVKFLTNFENTGNVHIRPTGNIFVKDWLGRQVALLDVNATQGTILPNAARQFESDWDDSFITTEPKIAGGQPVLDKNGKPETSLKINFSKILDLRIGRYTATELLVVSTDQRDLTYQAETSFWIFPWKVVIGTILLIIFAGVGFYNTLKNFVNRILNMFGLGKRKNEATP
jgi:hypothetical protein